MYSLEYLPLARRDMVDIAKYIGIKLANPDAADRLAEEMIQAAERLRNMPYMCPMYYPVKPLKHLHSYRPRRKYKAGQGEIHRED